MVNFKVSQEDYLLIDKIVDKAINKFSKGLFKRLELEMDLTACHSNGNPLRLQDLLDSDDYNFTHDIFGITDNINRKTGELENFFVPRFSKQNN
jgi:hypothetical protein